VTGAHTPIAAGGAVAVAEEKTRIRANVLGTFGVSAPNVFRGYVGATHHRNPEAAKRAAERWEVARGAARRRRIYPRRAVVHPDSRAAEGSGSRDPMSRRNGG
jgi:hypothetical protein